MEEEEVGVGCFCRLVLVLFVVFGVSDLCVEGRV